MDKNSLIDFNNDNCYKLSSPLIPAPGSARGSSAPRLSDIDNNPFDKVLRTIANKDDPFECNSDISVNNNFKNIRIDNENKENAGHLISPLQTPIKAKKYKRLSTSPLHISKNSAEEAKDESLNQLPIISEIHTSSLDCNVTDASLHILSDSILNSDDDFSNVASNLPLPDSPEDNITCNSNINTPKKLPMNIPAVIIQDESKSLIESYSTCGPLNNAFIDNLSVEDLKRKLSTRSSTASKESFNPNSFNAESLGTSDISNVLPSVSSVTSKDNESDNYLDKAFIKENSEIKSFVARKCMSARKPSNHFTNIARTKKSETLNNSFAGYNYNDRNIKLGKFRFPDNYDDDSVFLEATQLAEVFRTSAASRDLCANLNNEDISVCSPPWEDEEVVFVDDCVDDEKSKENNEKIEPVQIVPDININTDDEVTVLQLVSSNKEDTSKCNDTELKSKQNIDEDNYDIGKNIEEQENLTLIRNNETGTTDNIEVKNAKDLLHNLTAILNNSGALVDQRKLGENLLNSLALALNMENPVVRNSTEDDKPIKKLQRSKSDSKVSEKSRPSLAKQENKLIVPKIKTQSAAPVKLDKNLKVRNEKEKVTTKGPLKAIIPLTNMAKNKRSIVPKVNLPNTPPKQSANSLFQIRKTSTPNEPKIKPPIAQSTPDVSKKQGADINSATPLSKRHFGFSISPLSRPASTGDISNTCLNNSLSPKNTSGSTPNLNKSSSNLSKQSSNSSIPTIKYLNRRNSASDMSTSRSSALNRSYENNKPIRPPVQLKRSSSFQNKSVTTLETQKTNNFNNNNTVKKYGIPGTLKSLKLIPRVKKTAGD